MCSGCERVLQQSREQNAVNGSLELVNNSRIDLFFLSIRPVLTAERDLGSGDAVSVEYGVSQPLGTPPLKSTSRGKFHGQNGCTRNPVPQGLGLSTGSRPRIREQEQPKRTIICLSVQLDLRRITRVALTPRSWLIKDPNRAHCSILPEEPLPLQNQCTPPSHQMKKKETSRKGLLFTLFCLCVFASERYTHAPRRRCTNTYN